jgi:hypothetical protein
MSCRNHKYPLIIGLPQLQELCPLACFNSELTFRVYEFFSHLVWEPIHHKAFTYTRQHKYSKTKIERKKRGQVFTSQIAFEPTTQICLRSVIIRSVNLSASEIGEQVFERRI